MVPTVQSEQENYQCVSHSCTLFSHARGAQGSLQVSGLKQNGTLFIHHVSLFLNSHICDCAAVLLWEEVNGVTLSQWIQVSCSCEGAGHAQEWNVATVGLMCHDLLQMPQAYWHHLGWVFWALRCQIGLLLLWEPCEWWWVNNYIHNASVLQCCARSWLRIRVGFHSWCVCRQRQTQGGAFQAGFFAALFSLGFSLLYHSVCCPAMISGKATVKTKKELLESSNHLCFLFSHDERGSPHVTHSSVVYDVICMQC